MSKHITLNYGKSSVTINTEDNSAVYKRDISEHVTITAFLRNIFNRQECALTLRAAHHKTPFIFTDTLINDYTEKINSKMES